MSPQNVSHFRVKLKRSRRRELPLSGLVPMKLLTELPFYRVGMVVGYWVGLTLIWGVPPAGGPLL